MGARVSKTAEMSSEMVAKLSYGEKVDIIGKTMDRRRHLTRLHIRTKEGVQGWVTELRYDGTFRVAPCGRIAQVAMKQNDQRKMLHQTLQHGDRVYSRFPGSKSSRKRLATVVGVKDGKVTIKFEGFADEWTVCQHDSDGNGLFVSLQSQHLEEMLRTRAAKKCLIPNRRSSI